MHMADALISPAVGGTMMAAAVGVSAYSIRKIRNEMDDSKIPLMGVMGAFIFAAQMINFSIPGTGSSGHLGGGILLAVLLGPQAGFLTMAAVLLIQALFFGDGGLLAYGCNLFNLGFYTCFIAYPLIYKRMTRKGITSGRILGASVASALVGLQLGSFSVVLETLFSGKTEIPFNTFLLLMQPIHLAIGLVEGLVTASVVTFIWKARPEILEAAAAGKPMIKAPMKRVLIVLLVAAVIFGGGLSLFASSAPDGLEWSLEKAAGTSELEASNPIHDALAMLQGKTAILPDYDFKAAEGETAGETAHPDGQEPFANAGTSFSGLVGGALTLALAVLAGVVVSGFRRKKRKAASCTTQQ